MKKIRFGLIGTGYRSLYFIRIAKCLPEIFELTGVVCRNEARAKEHGALYGVNAVGSIEALLETKPEFVVSCVPRAIMEQTLEKLLEAGMPALSETPLAMDDASLMRLWAIHQRTGTPLQLAEQYFLWPTHQARRALLDRGLLGDVHNCWLSVAHDYHGVSLLRFFLQPQPGEIAIRARSVNTPIIVTGARDGIHTDGEVGFENRTFAHFDYPDGKLGLYDFCGTQYRSATRTSHLRILGTRGEIFDDEVLWTDAQNRPQRARLEVRKDLKTGTIRAVDFEGERLYANPFPSDVPMIEDEIAIADVLRRMGETVRTGRPFYPDAYAYGDTYLAIRLWDLAARDAMGKTERMPWDEA